MTTSLLMFIVAWCGTPTPYRLEVAQVNKCRDRLMACIISGGGEKVLKSCTDKITMGD